MTIPVPSQPANGRWARGFEPCVRYGPGGNPLCNTRLDKQKPLWGSNVTLLGRPQLS
ncbi:hypothetical protein ABZ468_48745 [Streptomyces sp. NPDC005708]|uniref:hypothetical protein n=1 Tax=unclassified Streptomyces TaxID=2593676 RepID=UPI0033F3B3FB